MDTQVDGFCDAVRRYMQECRDFVIDGSCPLMVCPVGLSDSALEVLVYGFTPTREHQPFIEAHERLVSALRKAVADVETSLAHPTQTVFPNGDLSSGGTTPLPPMPPQPNRQGILPI